MTNEDKADFSLVLASSVHDMKNSLGMLLNSLDSLMQDMPAQDEGQARRFAVLQYEASRINSELIQLLTIYRMQNDHLPVQVDEHFVSDLLEEQVARNDTLFATRNLQLTLDCDPDLLWYFDAELIGGVVHNVLVNGARYSHSQLLAKAEIINDELIITVADDGDGYPPFMLGCPEQNFTRSVSFSEGNTSLGLYFAQQVAALHGRDERRGRIRLSNGGPLGGGVFQVYLP